MPDHAGYESRLRELEHISEAAREFTPDRLTVAREMAGLEIKELAERIQVSPSAVTQFEKGKARPKPETLIRLALALGVPAEFFAAEPLPELPIDTCHFRSLRSATVRERRRLIAHGRVVRRIVEYLRDLVSFPAEQLSSLCRQVTGPADVEELALAVRDAWNLGQGPISDVVGLLEARGVIPVEVPGHSAKLDAFSVWVEDLPVVFLTPEKDSGSRRRFDAAHELGHLLMHRGRAAGDAEAEREAHAFASAFLLPRAPFLSECPRRLDWARLRQMKKRWGVSLAALIRRAFELGLYTEATYRRAYAILNQRGWRTEEPDEPEMERPTLLARAVVLLGQAGYSLGRLAEDLRLSESLIERLLGLGISGAPDSLPKPE
ncbi:MAG TPA: XRE family transcriptional regulator [Longimicrobiaceae bacterium]|nr:XRE family transcriptional regulator [Longimicrobiaceae bacterium]